MRGSLAVWCATDGRTVDGQEPRLVLHFNIWRDLPGGIPNVLDVGFLFENPRTVDRAFLYIPEKVDLGNLEDLSPVLQEARTLSAVFNDTLSVGQNNANCFEALKGEKIAFHVARINFNDGSNISLENLREEEGCEGTVITLGPGLIRKMDQVGKHYVRFRIRLTHRLSSIFISDITPSDQLFLSTFYKSELIEFRVNEKRNFSAELTRRWNELPPTVISEIHYLLVRDLRVEMAQAHTPFRKMRRLEPRLWNNYLQALGEPDAQNMIIYHWRVPAEKGGNPIEDFVALTLFRYPKPNLFIYAVAIVILGGLGSSIQALLTLLAPIKNHSQDNIAIQSCVFVILSLALILLYGLISARYRTFQPRHSCIGNFANRTCQRIARVIQGCWR